MGWWGRRGKQNHRITETEGIPWDELVQPHAQAGPAKAGYPGLRPVMFCRFTQTETPQTELSVPVFDQHCNKKVFPWIHMKFHVFLSAAIAICCCHQLLLRRGASPVTASSWNPISLSISHHVKDVQSLNNPNDPVLNSFKLPREVMDALSPEIFKARFDGTLNSSRTIWYFLKFSLF